MNLDQREVAIKIVYYGPALSGKTTNLQSLHLMLDPKHRGKLMSLETHLDRTLFFDLLPLQYQTPSGLRVKVKLFTVPGQVIHNETRRAVLAGADAVVFVADSQRSQALSNSLSFKNLKENLKANSLDFDTLPMVIQFNKRDLENIKPVEEIRRDWGPTRFPTFLSVATQGKGVFETFEAILKMALKSIDQKYDFNRKFGFDPNDFIDKLKSERIKQALDLKRYLVTSGEAKNLIR